MKVLIMVVNKANFEYLLEKGAKIDIVDAELRHILEPGLQNLNLRPESTISGSLSSISPPLPPLSPDGSIQHTNTTNNHTTSSNTITSKINTNKSQLPQVS